MISCFKNFLFIFIFIKFTLQLVEGRENVTNCGEYHANFKIKDVLGKWYTVAILPEEMFPETQNVSCYDVEFSEIDMAGFKWLLNSTTKATNAAKDIKGTIIRQRYHTEHPFDVWSKAVDGVNGCFKQVLSLNADKENLNKPLSHDAMMQLHLIEGTNGSGPFLLQMLWGKLISVVIHRRYQGVTLENLKPVTEVLTKIRGPQRPPKLCQKSFNHAK